ncbi:MAG: hypothetical protein JO117_04090, partial [Verrucomicrobia bacterium]|nr:hypothetical protein [Verrucomicrobiota bacterium]
MTPAADAAAVVRVKLVIAYDGRPFRGWQSQAGGGAVQDFLETALSRVCDGRRVPVHGAGRTDAGVHACGQVAHSDLPAAVVATRFANDGARLAAALNAHLPAAIRIVQAVCIKQSAAGCDWHAR